jgi:hypothetical protein
MLHFLADKYQSFGRTCCFHHHVHWSVPWIWKQRAYSKRSNFPTKLHDVTSHNYNRKSHSQVNVYSVGKHKETFDTGKILFHVEFAHFMYSLPTSCTVCPFHVQFAHFMYSLPILFRAQFAHLDKARYSNCQTFYPNSGNQKKKKDAVCT